MYNILQLVITAATYKYIVCRSSQIEDLLFLIVYSCQEKHYTQVCRIMFFSGTWSSPSFSGTRPSPCSAFSLTSIDDHRALLYGGWDGEHRCCVSDLYLIDFQLMVILCELCIQQ